MHSPSRRSLGIALSSGLFLAACEAPRPPGNPASESHAYVLNADQGTLAQVDMQAHTVRQIRVGTEPMRVVRNAERLFISNRGDRTISVFNDIDGELVEAGVIQTGAEPYGLAANGSRVYVAAALSGQVIEYDANTLAQLRSFSVPGEPRGLALHKSGHTLLVGTAFGGKLGVINLLSGDVRLVELPAVFSNSFNSGGQQGTLSREIRTDPVYSEAGDQFAIGALYVDNDCPIDDPNDPTNPTPTEPDPNAPVPPPDGMGGLVAPPPDGGRPGGGGSCGGYGGRFTPVVVEGDSDETGEPAMGTAEVVMASSFTGGVDQFGNQTFRSINGYPSAVIFSSDGQLVLAAIEGGDAVVAIDFSAVNNGGIRAGAAETDAAVAPGVPIGPGGGGFSFRPTVGIATRAAPMALRLRGDKVLVQSNFDRTLQSIDVAEVTAFLRPQSQDNGMPLPGVPAQPRSSDESGAKADPIDPGFVAPPQPALPEARETITLAERSVSDDVDYGRRLFFATNNSKMSGDGNGVSCATCHMGGRNDGLTWIFARGPRQTPSLAGDLTPTVPVGWQGDRGTVAEDAMMTSQGLMGGAGLTVADTLAIDAFVNSSRRADTKNFRQTSEQAARGQALFESYEVGCVSCHSGAAYTNNMIVPIFGLEGMKVRHLVGIASSAPYFNDGSAATLRDVLVRSRDGSMGNTANLSDNQMDDLVAYLESL